MTETATAPSIEVTDPSDTAPRRPGIRRTWFAAIGMFLMAIVATGGGTLALMRSQRSDFDRTSTHSALELEALSKLQREILEAEVPLGGILYELDREGQLDEQWAQWEAHAAAIDGHFKRLEDLMDGPDAAALTQPLLDWAEVADGVQDARSMWGTGEVAAALAQGNDPFGPTVWASLGDTEHALATVAVTSVERLRRESDDAGQRQSIAEVILLVTLVGAAALGVASGRRLSRRMIHPLLELRGHVARLRDGQFGGSLVLGAEAGIELAELAEAMSEMEWTLSRSQSRLLDQANTDGLTGLANRRAFEEALARATAQGAEYHTAVLLIDIDDFKRVNDSMGHAAGDELLVAIAGRMAAAARSQDTVARLGGDEFAIIVEGDDALGSATALAQRVLSSLEQPISVQGRLVDVSCSIGVADGHGTALAAELLNRADGAMYVAKGRGKACFEMFDPVLHASMLWRSDLKADLRRAAADGQLVAHYQPIVDLQSEVVIGLEALVRWQHPDRGLLMPGDFIDLAEESGDIVGIGDWIIDRACHDLVTYQACSTQGGALWISVNVSPRQVLSGTLATTVHDALRRHGIQPGALILEITEASLLSDPVRAAQVLNELRAEGVRIAIDDFGTGFSSLQYLSLLPIDVLKIDRSFVAGSGDRAGADVILRSIVTMAQGLGLDIVAEGIELTTELDRLRDLGAMAGQGYLLARPMPAAAAAEHVAHPASAVVSLKC